MSDDIIAKESTERPIPERIKHHKTPANFHAVLTERARRIERMINKKFHPFKVIERMHRYLDKGLKEAYPQPTCKRGCSHCCHVAVGIPAIEAQYIEHKTGRKITHYGSGELDLNERRPCPFLKNNECSIYEHRPAVCRTFMSFEDPAFCINPKGSHWLLTLSGDETEGFSWANVVFNSVMVYYADFDRKRWAFCNDIRAFFGDD